MRRLASDLEDRGYDSQNDKDEDYCRQLVRARATDPGAAMRADLRILCDWFVAFLAGDELRLEFGLSGVHGMGCL